MREPLRRAGTIMFFVFKEAIQGRMGVFLETGGALILARWVSATIGGGLRPASNKSARLARMLARQFIYRRHVFRASQDWNTEKRNKS